ncbi:MAG: VOC family protein [Elusimicrobiales bacterium]|nr:VOC family protein [Elusimicrobiales bacterium]
MKFCWCTLTVANLEESVNFYRDIVGLPVARRFAAGPGTEICFLGEGETKVELVCGPGRLEPGADGISLGFEVGSLDAALETVKAKGLDLAGGPFQPNPKIKFFYVRDPDGHKVQFVENL